MSNKEILKKISQIKKLMPEGIWEPVSAREGNTVSPLELVERAVVAETLIDVIDTMRGDWAAEIREEEREMEEWRKSQEEKNNAVG